MNQRNDSAVSRWDEDERLFGQYGYRRLGLQQGSIEARIFKLANRRKGRITVSDVVIETGLGVHQAEDLLQNMVDNNRVTMEVTDDGMVYYEFPEIIRRMQDE
jgi:hypothetical protein